MVTCYAVLVGQAFGANHDLTNGLQRFAEYLTLRVPEFQYTLASFGTLGPALLLHALHVRCQAWFMKLETSSSYSQPPNFADIMDGLDIQNHSWKCDLPTKYQLQLAKSSGVPSHVKTQGVGSDGGSSMGTLSTAGSTDSERSSDSKSKSEAVINVHFNSAFAAYQKDPRGFTQMKKDPTDKSWPKDVPGIKSAPCLAYHFKGKCSSDCGRRADHKTHSQETDDSLLAWALAHLEPRN